MPRVLVVDDEEGIRSFIAEVLAGEGLTVVEAPDGRAAQALLEQQTFHLVVTDLRMPHLDGMALLRHLRAEQPEVEVVVLTAHGTVAGAVEAMKLGAFDYLTKPLSGPDELRLVAARALERRRQRERLEAVTPDQVRLVARSEAMAQVAGQLAKVAPTETTVLLLGESGTGKEVAARTVHAGSRRADGPFVAVNCAALAEGVLESELFGHEKGAFSGASARRRGRFELAEGGTLFLDEVAELRPELQVKLLRVIQERRFERVGGAQTVAADVRLVAATNRDLAAELAAGRFREDLYHRLAVFPVRLPPLRERHGDLVPLAQELLLDLGHRLGRSGLALEADAERALSGYAWPGNVRELRNALERAAILAEGGRLRASDLGLGPRPPDAAGGGGTLRELEREAIRRALLAVGGHRKQAAERLGIGLRTLYDKLKEYGL